MKLELGNEFELDMIDAALQAAEALFHLQGLAINAG